MCSRVSAYLYMGASVQMAFTLGLHRDQLPESGTSVEREQNRRIWWTLFILDQEISSRGGSPTVVDERYTKVTTPMSSEQVEYIRCKCLVQMLTLTRYCTLAYTPRCLGYLPQSLYVALNATLFRQYIQKDRQTRYPSQQSPTPYSCFKSGTAKCRRISNTRSLHHQRTNVP